MITLARMRARSLLATIDSAINAGDWNVDGAADPEGAMLRLQAALAIPETPDHKVSGLADDLADIGRAAIDAGDWTPPSNHDVSHVRPKTARTNDSDLVTAA